MTSKILNSLPHLANDSVTKQVTDILSDLIVTGKIVEGDFLPTEEDLCHEFGIGRSSVRKLHGKGVEVIDESAKATTEMLHISLRMKKTTVRDFMEFRKSMEIKMTEMAACRATSEQVKTIEEVLEKMKTDEYRLETFADYDFMFHKSIADASGNKVFSLMMETIRPMLYSHIIYTLNPNFNPELSNHFHETILEAIKAKDPNAASAAMAAHLAGTKSIIDELESANVTL